MISSILLNNIVRARKSPWIETRNTWRDLEVTYVRARKSPWIETLKYLLDHDRYTSGLVRARGLKL